ncbi:hypothetical protein [Tsukamurella tyrosinosolvens]|uniref:hypothetical protein n=1 Tax=Tsukamurella tyrosinosolvens TaxID=57704 RepID=UPI0007977D17|nr:hypothetical protein [Tsukamurella tyrosinosolvens]KXP08847.1 hypothetical protein AXK59_00025 [Tsukamurella tyrosinosolvens]KZL97077.1 hypothetical protein AXX05_16570 [Tsukamurella tyrosinosolvens]
MHSHQSITWGLNSLDDGKHGLPKLGHRDGFLTRFGYFLEDSGVLFVYREWVRLHNGKRVIANPFGDYPDGFTPTVTLERVFASGAWGSFTVSRWDGEYVSLAEEEVVSLEEAGDIAEHDARFD